MSEYLSEHDRYENQVLGRDFISMTPEAIRLRGLIDHLGELAIKAQDEAA